MDFSKRLSCILAERGLTQRELANMCGVDEASMSRYVNGSRKPCMDVLVRIAGELNVSVEYLTGNEEETSFKEIKHLLQTGEELPPIPLDECILALKHQVEASVARIGEYRGILHIRRHLAATPVFKGIPNFRDTRIAMLRAETVDELYAIMESAVNQIRESGVQSVSSVNW